LNQEVDIYEWDEKPPAALSNIMHATDTGGDRWDDQEETGDVRDVGATCEEDVIQDRGRDVEQDREKVEEPEIAAGGAATKDGIVAKDMANSFIHAPSMAYRCKLEVRNHLNCTCRTLAHADATALAVVQIDFKAQTRP